MAGPRAGGPRRGARPRDGAMKRGIRVGIEGGEVDRSRTRGASQRATITARGAEVRFGERVLWTGVDLDIERGTFVAILGPNGVGKSTLLKVVLDLQPLSAGAVTVLGSAPGRKRRRIGYVPQRK